MSLVKALIEDTQLLDGIGNGLPVGEHAAEPAGIDVILGRTLGGIGDLLLRGALGADEQNAAALGNSLRHSQQRLVQQWHGLREVDDVNAIARAVDVQLHLGIPAVLLVAEMDACFQKLAHGEFWQSHGLFLLRLIRRK